MRRPCPIAMTTTILTFKNSRPDDYDCSIYEYLQRGVEGLDDKEAIRFMNKSLTHGAMRRAIQHLAAKLASLGVQAGTVVTLCMPNLPVAVNAIYAINSLGAICSVLHPLTPSQSVLAQMARNDSRLLLCFDKLFLVEYKTLCEADIDVLLLSAGEYYPAIARGVIQSVNKVSKRRLSSAIAASTQAKVHVYTSVETLPPVPVVHGKGDDVCLYLHSGGTTGVPKTIPITNRMMNAEAINVINLTVMPEVGRSAMLMVLPIFHGFGIGVCLHAMLPFGVRVVLQATFDPKKSVRIIKRDKITILVGVPTMFEKILATKQFVGNNIRSLCNAYCGGDSMSPELKERFDSACEKAGSTCRLYQGYGLTETVAVCAANSPYFEDRAGSIGKPVVGVEMCVMDEDGQLLPDGARGEICVRGDTVMGGYLDSTPEGVLVETQGKVWLHTGDCGYRDDAGYYHFVGRKKRMSIIAGVNVYHQEIEQLAYAVDGVAAAAVTETTVNGKTCVKLWLTPAEGYSGDLKQSVLRYLRTQLTKYCVPREVTIVDEMPKTPMGKVDYRALAARG